jgi:hypothetical protein
VTWSDFSSSNDVCRRQRKRNCLSNLLGLRHLNFVDKSWYYWEQPRLQVRPLSMIRKSHHIKKTSSHNCQICIKSEYWSSENGRQFMRGSRDIGLQKYRCPDRHGPHFLHGPLFMQVCRVRPVVRIRRLRRFQSPDQNKWTRSYCDQTMEDPVMRIPKIRLYLGQVEICCLYFLSSRRGWFFGGLIDSSRKSIYSTWPARNSIGFKWWSVIGYPVPKKFCR